MIIEDDIYAFEYTDLLLTNEGYHVSYWPTSTGAADEIAQHQPDLILLDQRLDRSPNGWEILQAIRTEPSTTHIPVILVSSDHDFLRSHKQDIQALGGDILEKPFPSEQLLEKVEALTAGTNP
jgi:DNA-binding response OmpR family regulator